MKKILPSYKASAFYLLSGVSLSVLALSPSTAVVGDDDVQIALVANNKPYRTMIIIKAQPLSDALIDYSAQTGIGIVVNSKLINESVSKSVKGQSSPYLALRVLLEDSGLDYHRIGSKTVSLIPTRVIYSKAATSPAKSLMPLNSVSMPIEEMLVVGERRPQYTVPRGQPISSISRDQIQHSGYVSVESALNNIPMISSSVTRVNSAAFGSDGGFSLPEIRALGHNRTLVLLNGKRIASTIGGRSGLQGVDLNGIPPEEIDRVEIIRGNVAADYGGEAIGGVINLVLDRNPDGFTISSNAGTSQKWDNKFISNRLKYGTSIADNRGSISATLSHGRTEGLLLSDREITHNLAWFAKDGVRASPSDGIFTAGYGGSSTSANGSLVAYLTQEGELQGFDGWKTFVTSDDGASINSWEGSPDQLFNYTEGQSLYAPMERISGRFYSDYRFENGDTIRAELSYSTNALASKMSPVVLAPMVGALSYDHPIHTLDINDDQISSDVRKYLQGITQGKVSEIVLSRRLVELGPRSFDIEHKYMNVNIAYEGVLNDLWTYDFFVQYGSTRSSSRSGGHARASRLELALNPEQCEQTVGCVPLSLLGSQGISPEAADYIRAPDWIRDINSNQLYTKLQLDGDMDILGRPASLGFGAEMRRDHVRDQSLNNLDTAGAANIISGDVGGTITIGTMQFNSDWLLVNDAAYIHMLQVRFAAQLNKQRYTGSSFNFSAGIDLQPVEGLALTTSYQKGKRAPSLSELFTASTFNQIYFTDPCHDYLHSDDVKLIENCALDLPDDVGGEFYQTNQSAQGFVEGNKDLNHEKVESFNFGIDLLSTGVWPKSNFQAQLSVDYYNSKIENTITTASVSDVLFLCYQSAGLSHSFCGNSPNSGRDFINRNAITGQIQQLTIMPLSAGILKVSGLETEFSLKYSADKHSAHLFGLKDAELSIMHHYGLEHKTESNTSDYISNHLGTVQYPKHRLNGRISLNFEKWGVSWLAKIRGKSVASDGVRTRQDAQVPTVVYHDINSWFKMSDNTSIYMSILNVLDKQPPFFAYSSGSGTSPEYFDVVGRSLSIGFNMGF